MASATTVTADLESEPAHTVAITTGDVVPEALAGSCATDLAAGSAEVDSADFKLTEDGKRQNVGSCTYTCPGGMALLCPDRVDHLKSCVNDCCVLTPVGSGYSETQDDCTFPLFCNASTSV